jgi:biopolymer transport protein TolR
MAGGGGSPTSGRRKNLDAEINLVPFIDLLSMCICFLLMTAIWVEIGSIQIKQVLGTAGPAVTNEAVDLQVRFQANKDLEVQLEKGGKVVQKFLIDGETQDQKMQRFGQYMGQLMGAVMSEGTVPNITARVVPATGASYADLVTVLDLIKGFGVSNLAVIPVRE